MSATVKTVKKFLPNEVMCEIFKHLDARGLLTSQYVSRHWKEIADFFIQSKTWIFYQSITETGLKWETSNSKEISNRYYHLSCPHKDKLIIFGGFIGKGIKMDKREDLWTLDIPSHTWKLNKTTGELPYRMAYGRMLSYKDKIYMIGGQRTFPAGTKAEVLSNDIYVLDFGKLEWTLVKPQSRKPPLLSQHGANIWNDEIIVFGGINILTNNIGANEEGEKFPFDYRYYLGNDIYIFNIKTSKWRQVVIKGEAPCPRYGHSTFIYKDHLIVLGGASSCAKIYHDIWTLDMRNNDWNWRQVKCLKNNQPFNGLEIGLSPLAIFSDIIFGFSNFMACTEDYVRNDWTLFNKYQFADAQNACKYFALDVTRIISDEVVDWVEQSKPLVGTSLMGHSFDTRSKEIIIFGGMDSNTGCVYNRLTIGSIKQDRLLDLQMKREPRRQSRSRKNRRRR